jgi:hypothetical protein
MPLFPLSRKITMPQIVSSTDYLPLPPYQAVMSSDRVSSRRSQPSNQITSDRSAEALLLSELPLANFDIGYRLGENAMRRAKFLLQKTAPSLTIKALKDIFPEHDNFLTALIRLSGLTSLVPCVVFDILKASILLTGAAAEAVRGSLANVFDDINNPREKVAMKLILKSFEKRFLQTLFILRKFGLETPRSLHQEFAGGNISLYKTLTLVFTAFSSRRAPVGHLCLASKKILSKENCPKQGQALFTLISQIKDHLILSSITPDISQDVAIEKLKRWIPIIKIGLKDSDEIHTLLAQHEVDEDNKQSFWDFMDILKRTQKEITNIRISDDQALVLKDAPVQLALQNSTDATTAPQRHWN